MEITEKEREMLEKEREEIKKLTMEIIEMLNDPKNRIKIKQKVIGMLTQNDLLQTMLKISKLGPSVNR